MSLRRTIALLIPASFCVLALPALATAQAPAQPPAPAAQAPAGPRVVERVVVIDMQGAVTGCNEGLRDFEALGKKFEPRRTELQKLGAEVEGLKGQLATQGPTMAPAARDALTKSIETKTKALQRMAEDSQNEFQQQQNETAQRILQKLAPVLKKYADDHGFGLVLDGSMPWPQGPVVMVTSALDITKAVVDAYNIQSAVPAPPKTTK